jgi:N-acetylgalactosamine-6-sulfatase
LDDRRRSMYKLTGVRISRLPRATVFTGILLLAVSQLLPADRNVRPNVVFIFADDLGWGDLGCYGNQEVRTPNLDQLAAEGSLFTQFYVNGSVCSPSRTAFLTGHYPARHKVHGHFASDQQNQDRGMPNWLDTSATNVTRLLKEAGYATAHFGKWHLGSGKGAPSPKEYGIDDFVTAGGNRFTSGTRWAHSDPYFRAHSTDSIVDEAIRFMKENRDKPFYINAWTLLTHATLHPTDEQLELYKRFAPSSVPYKAAKQIYLASVTALDSAVGRLIKSLDELGLSENTLVIFSSDNGPEDINIRNAGHSGVGSAGPFRGRKRSLYEGGLRMPFIVRWSNRVPAGLINSTSVLTAVDFLPTVCQLAGVRLPSGYRPDGEDISDILLGDQRARSRAIMWEWRFRVHGHVLHRSPQLSIREGKWKLLMNPDKSRIELYDIPRDPSELQNLVEAQPQVVEFMSQRLLAWQKTLPEGPVDPLSGRNNYPWPDENR